MIKNERQYRITRSLVERFVSTLAEIGSRPDTAPALHPLILQAQREALESQLSDLQAQIEEYEALRTGQRKAAYFESLEDLPRALIQARIATGWTQRELAEKLGLKEQQIQRYESTDYASASLDRTRKIAGLLGVKVRSSEQIAVS